MTQYSEKAVWGVMSTKDILTLYFSYAFFAFCQANMLAKTNLVGLSMKVSPDSTGSF